MIKMLPKSPSSNDGIVHEAVDCRFLDPSMNNFMCVHVCMRVHENDP